MDDVMEIYTLSDAELDAVVGGHHGGDGGGGGTVIEIVNITIGEVIAAATGNSTVTVNLAGIGNNTTTNSQSHGHHRG